MTDPTTAEIARRCRDLAGRPLPGEIARAATVHLIDTLGCAAGATGSPPARIAARLAARQSEVPPARVLGSGLRTSVELAAFANAVMARYLDYNDTYTGAATGHPSDVIAAVLAVAEAADADGAALLTALAVAYEAYGSIGRVVRIRDRGFDQGVLVGLGAAAGAATLLGLDAERFADALGLSVTMAIPTRSTRAGALSMWKGCATAAAGRFGVFAARLAAEGITGPDRPIEGKHGLWEQVTGRFELAPFAPDAEPWVLQETAIKRFPLEFNAQSAVELILALREQVAADRVAAIHVDTYWSAYDEIGNEPEKWAPTTRETADHSLPYLLAVALLDGEVTAGSFDDDHLADPRLRELMAAVTVAEDAAFTERWPAAVPCRVTVTTTGGETLTREVDHPLGHPRRPLPDEAVAAKFASLVGPLLGAPGATVAFERLHATASIAHAGEILDLFLPVPAVARA